MDRRFDPRSIVTPYAFSVHPDLLGVPLATPGQRLGAILVDLVVIGFLSQVGGFPLAAASTVLLFWLAFKKPGRDAFGKLFRVSVGCLGFLVLIGTAIAVVAVRYADDFEEIVRQAEDAASGEVSAASEGGDAEFGSGGAAGSTRQPGHRFGSWDSICASRNGRPQASHVNRNR